MKIVSIEDIAEKVDYGLTEKAKDEKIGPKFLRITDIQDDKVNWDAVPYCKCDEKEFEKNKLEVGDIVFARTGATTGKSFLVQNLNHKAVYASYLIRLSLITDQVLPEFVSYFFKSDKYWNQIYADSDGATLPSFNATKLKALKIPLPNLSDQKAIVAKLNRAQRLIDIDKEMLAKYDELIQSVFLEMFGDPVTNPKGWKVRKLGDVCNTGSGGTPSRKNKEYYNGDIPWIKSGELKGGKIYNAEEKITDTALDNTSAKLAPVNSLLIAMYGATVGRVAELKIKASINQAICYIDPDREKVTNTFLLNFLKLITDELLDKRVGGGQPNINQGIVKDIDLFVPTIDRQNKFEFYVNKIELDKEKSSFSLKKSEDLFSSLVQEAFG